MLINNYHVILYIILIQFLFYILIILTKMCIIIIWWKAKTDNTSNYLSIIIMQTLDKGGFNMELEITTENFDELVLNSDKTVLVDFWADWCGPCKMLSPVIKQIAEERNDIVVGKVNVDEQPGLGVKYKIASIPTVIVFKNGEITNKSIGLVSKAELLSLLA